MRNGQAFVGFNEGLIDFAPTFKYDVLRTMKRAKAKGSKHHWKHQAEKHRSLYEVEEHDHDDDDGDEDGEGGEGASMTSSVWTSVHSRPGTDVDDDEFFGSSPSSQAVSTPASLAHKISIAAAAHKAKHKWMALLASTTLPNSPNPKRRKTMYTEPSTPIVPATPNVVPSSPNPKHPKKRHTSPHPPTPTIPTTPNVTVPTPVTSTELLAPPPAYTPPARSASPESKKHGLLRPSPIRTTSTKSNLNAQSGDEDTDDEDNGVYDSSNKKRVPSW